MYNPLSLTLALLALLASTNALNFPYEQTQLTDADVALNPDVSFGDPSIPPQPQSECKVFPSDPTWPSPARWSALNASVDGTLLATPPPASACHASQADFDSDTCTRIQQDFSLLTFNTESPNAVMNTYLTGSTCLPTSNSSSPCSPGGYPVYVVNATSVKHIQAAVNFARNTQVRLVIKNTGHDFLGRSAGAGSLSVWTHHLKAFEYVPKSEVGEYTGKAARVGAGLQSFDLFTAMSENNITVIAPQDQSIGTFGGYMHGAGHSWLGSKYGLMADQVLSVQLVTADGQFITADPTQNTDLFWSVRGGGGSTFGVLTSAIIKAYPPISITSIPLTFSTSPTLSNTTFWSALRIWFSDLSRIADAGGFTYQFIFVNPPSNSSNVTTYTLSATYYLPGLDANQSTALLAPLYTQLRDAGVNLTDPNPSFAETYASLFAGRGVSGGAGGGRFIGRLWPRANLDANNPDLLNTSISAIRAFVEEGGYTFHCVAYTPTLSVAGYPTSGEGGVGSAVNPPFRSMILHVTGFDSSPLITSGTVSEQRARYELLNSYAQRLRDATPGSGAYMNEADLEEPDFQESFYGANWGRLSGVKSMRDPWGVFWAWHGVGSEGWEIRTVDGRPTEDGQLCRVQG